MRCTLFQDRKIALNRFDVAPDGIATPRVRAGFEARGADMSHLARDTSLKRHGESRDIAGALLFLVSDLSAFVTGQTIIVDGGVTYAR